MNQNELKTENLEVMEVNIENYDNNIPSHTTRKRIYIFLLLANLFLNYDTGVIPASLLEILKEIKLDFKEQALLGSLVYLGLSFASLFVTPVFTRFGPSKVIFFVLLLNASCCFIFSFSHIKVILFSTRFLMGVTEAFVVIYAPVWVNNYAPEEHSAKWMGIMHAVTALGVIIGYVVAGVTINLLGSFLTWRFAIQVQGIVQIPIAFYFYYENENFINVDVNNQDIDDDGVSSNSKPSLSRDNKSYRANSVPVKGDTKRAQMIKPRSRLDSRIDAIETSNLSKYCYQTKLVITNPLYIFVTLALCSTYFIVTGIQFWMTSYLIDILENDPITVIIVYSVISITAPMGGVIMGGIFADRYGGYKGKNVLRALKLCFAFGVVAFVFAFPIGFLYSIIYVSVLLWSFLFFGAAIVPVGTGIMVSSVRRDCQATSSSISQLIFNFFGYFLSPILTGVIMDIFEDKHTGYKWGMRLIFWWCIFAVIFMSLAWVFAYKRYKDGTKEENDLMEEEMNQNMDHLMKLEIMRRMAQNV